MGGEPYFVPYVYRWEHDMCIHSLLAESNVQYMHSTILPNCGVNPVRADWTGLWWDRTGYNGIDKVIILSTSIQTRMDAVLNLDPHCTAEYRLIHPQLPRESRYIQTCGPQIYLSIFVFRHEAIIRLLIEAGGGVLDEMEWFLLDIHVLIGSSYITSNSSGMNFISIKEN